MTPIPCVPVVASTSVRHGTHRDTGLAIVMVMTGARPRKVYEWRPLRRVFAGWGRP